MAKGPLITSTTRRLVLQDLGKGLSPREVAEKRRLHVESVRRIRRAAGEARNPHHAKMADASKLGLPVPHDQLPENPKRALADFAYFRLRYFGRVSMPWQVDMAEEVIEALATPHKEFLLLNAPPGAGKTTIMHDLAAWITERDRSIRGCFASRVMTNATRMAMSLRRTLESTYPEQADDDLKQMGLAQDAVSTMALDFGRYQSEGDFWSQYQYVVLQAADRPITEKEPTWSAYGVDSGLLSNRFDIILGDDIVDEKNTVNAEAQLKVRATWDKVIERRLEPRGVLVLFGQRMGPDDLYAYNKAKRRSKTSDEPKYRIKVYPAHDEERCTLATWEEHEGITAPWPESCLLDPYRLPWDELASIEENTPADYRILYQQEDVDYSKTLVDPVWITGGRDRDGVECPGCWDADRALLEVPPGLAAPVVSVVCADPSPARFWAVQWWLWQPATKLQHLMNIANQTMKAPDFLDWNQATGKFTGLLEDWWQLSRERGHRIRYVIVESNAAQRFLLQYDHVRRWCQLRGVLVIPHATWHNKADDKYGVWTLGPEYRYGRVRLPGAKHTRFIPLKLVHQLTRYPGAAYDDQVMCHWFFRWNARRLYTPLSGHPPASPRPSWMKQEVPT